MPKFMCWLDRREKATYFFLPQISFVSNGRTFRPVVGGAGPAVFGAKKVVVNETPRRPRNVHGSLLLRWTLALGFPTVPSGSLVDASQDQRPLRVRVWYWARKGAPFFFSLT